MREDISKGVCSGDELHGFTGHPQLLFFLGWIKPLPSNIQELWVFQYVHPALSSWSNPKLVHLVSPGSSTWGSRQQCSWAVLPFLRLAEKTAKWRKFVFLRSSLCPTGFCACLHEICVRTHGQESNTHHILCSREKNHSWVQVGIVGTTHYQIQECRNLIKVNKKLSISITNKMSGCLSGLILQGDKMLERTWDVLR